MEPKEKLKLFRESQHVEGGFVQHVTNCEPCRTESKYCKEGQRLWLSVEDIQERCRNAMKEPGTDGSDKPDAYVCQCGKAYSFSMFNCACGLMACGHGWRIGGPARNTCDRCHGEMRDKLERMEDAFKELFKVASNAREEPVQAVVRKAFEDGIFREDPR